VGGGTHETDTEGDDQMSHSVVLVCLRPGADIVGQHFDFADAVNTALEAALAPFNEELEVEPYRDYEQGEPEQFWLYSSFKRSAEHVANGTGVKPYEPDAPGWSSATSKQTPEEQLAQLKAEADLFHALPDPVTWADIVELHNRHYTAEESTRLMLSEDGRAYTMSTYNELSRWDWWLLGGRWTGYFRVKDEHVGSDLLAGGRPGTLTEANRDHRRTDAAPKGLIDFAAMRRDKGDEAKEQ
jgi:hypothetical protein